VHLVHATGDDLAVPDHDGAERPPALTDIVTRKRDGFAQKAFRR
jgi:hypothetical protein